MDAIFGIFGNIALGRREKDKCANGTTFFGDIDAKLFLTG
jgi:hypothetical protein